MSERIPFPDKLVNWYDIARGVGEVIVESVFRMPRQLASHGDHFQEPRPVSYQPELPFPEGLPIIERPDAAQLGRTAMVYADPLTHIREQTNRWDSEGNYFEQ